MEPEINKYGNRVRSLRRKRRLTQGALELRAELAFGTISRIENNKTNPSKETLYKLASALEVSLSEAIELFLIDKVLKPKKFGQICTAAQRQGNLHMI